MTELGHGRRRARAGGGSVAGVCEGDSRLSHGRAGLSHARGGAGPSRSHEGVGSSRARGTPGSDALARSDRRWLIQVMDIMVMSVYKIDHVYFLLGIIYMI
jgi:hypothetical protein